MFAPREQSAKRPSQRRAARSHLAARSPLFSWNDQLESQAQSTSASMVRHAHQPHSGHERHPHLLPAQPDSSLHLPKEISQVVASPGHALGTAERSFFEPRFGFDFGRVRIHTNEEAAHSAKAIRASAYTLGSSVVFAKEKYVPYTEAGRVLLGHELAHVVQQGIGYAHGIQRAPDDAGVADAGVNPDAVTTTQAQPDVFDPDANEAAARTQNPDLPQIDRALKSPEENEQAAAATVLEAFGGEDKLNEQFEQLPAEVIKTVDHYGKTDKTANRVQFFVRMRLYFDSWAEIIAHFKQIVEVKHDPVDVFLHKDAADRLERALSVLKQKRHPFPSISEGFSLRDRHEGAIQSAGLMTHALGYAFDVAAGENPKIGFMKPGETGRHDPIQIASAIDPSGAHMDMGASNPKIIEAMGKRTAGDTSLSAADDKDPVAQKYFELFAQQFQHMQAGSLEFLTTISKDHREKLLQLRKNYLDVLRKIAAEKKKGKKGDAILITALESERRQLLAAIPSLATEWLTAIDKAIAKTLAAHPGMDKLRSPGDITKDLKSAEKNLKTGKQADVQSHQLESKALAERDTASQVVKLAEQREHRAPGGADFKKALAATALARENLQKKLDVLVDAMQDRFQKDRELAAAQDQREGLSAELKRSSDPKLKGAWDWIQSLRELKHSLGSPDLSTPAGLKEYEALTTGNLGSRMEENPPLLRLLDVGIFNPKGAFDLEFFEEMAHSGFWPGATWNFGGADPMHFELLEGRNRTRSPGKVEKNKTK